VWRLQAQRCWPPWQQASTGTGIRIVVCWGRAVVVRQADGQAVGRVRRLAGREEIVRWPPRTAAKAMEGIDESPWVIAIVVGLAAVPVLVPR